MRRMVSLFTVAAMMAVLMVASAAPAMADHWFLYEDSEGECGWNWFLEYPFWEYDCHVDEEPEVDPEEELNREKVAELGLPQG
jgi:hypothetical protein